MIQHNHFNRATATLSAPSNLTVLAFDRMNCQGTASNSLTGYRSFISEISYYSL